MKIPRASGWSSLLLLILLQCCCRHVSCRPFSRTPQAIPYSSELQYRRMDWRGGSQDNHRHVAGNDEERYSRQVYALGARAHGLIRSATIILDGPPESGLMYETAKNLALSGVHRILLLESDSSVDAAYFEGSLDDLGRAFVRAARNELNDARGEMDTMQLLKEYIQKLNPSVAVHVITRESLSTEIETFRRNDNKLILVALDRPLSTQLALNNKCRQLDLAFCSADTAGVFGLVFCDFGNDFVVHDADGETPLATPVDKLVLGDDNVLMVHCVNGEKHDVSKGDIIQFKCRDGSIAEDVFRVEKVYTPFRFQISVDGQHDLNEVCARINQQAATFSRIKQPQTLHFSPLSDAIAKAIDNNDSLFTACDLEKSFDKVRRSALITAFHALSVFVEKNGRLPKNKEQKRLWKLMQLTLSKHISESDNKRAKRHCKHFVRGCSAKFVPMQAVFGAIAAQEALKAVSGLYCPVHQFLLYDCDEVLHGVPKMDDHDNADEIDVQDNVPGLRAILGSVLVKKLASQNVFVVGAGAIGCEILKNLAALGVATGAKGRIHVTDMDTIEKSNLSRQFLFRDADIGNFKSAAAHQAVMQFNPRMKIDSHSSKVGDLTHSPFHEDFWSTKVDVVLNALDNVEARLFIDRQCVAYQKALVDSGTLGSKGNVQVVVPHQSESYASSADPPEQAIPVCTLKNFPYSISHTIQWGRDLFDGLFQVRPKRANTFIEELKHRQVTDLVESLLADHDTESGQVILSELQEDLSDVADVNAPMACLNWAMQLAHEMYYQSALDLIVKHPLDSVDEDGEPFWTGIRRPPMPMLYREAVEDDDKQSYVNANLIQFVKAAARLRLKMIRSNQPSSHKAEYNITVDETVVKHGLQSTGETCLKRRAGLIDLAPNELQALALRNTSLHAIDFEKDDDSNGHVEFVTAASNLRAISYGIPPVDSMETRRIAGSIVPAMITTTAFVAALSCLELIKLTQNTPLRLHRNAFVNLALPFFAFTSPLPAEEISGLNGNTFTIWDRLLITEKKKDANKGGLSIRTLIRRLERQLSESGNSVVVTSLSIGEFMLYANYLHENDADVLDCNLWDHIKNALTLDDEFQGRTTEESSVNIDCERYVDLSVSVEESATNIEVELPPIRVQRYAI
ncbi:hypothetical protein MPSEU_000504200 [Mayamaea pseudoterrestris]|nr:hypothetical protein MPSEU_000504200 [Mayamaea pseudoterrestris]